VIRACDFLFEVDAALIGRVEAQHVEGVIAQSSEVGGGAAGAHRHRSSLMATSSFRIVEFSRPQWTRTAWASRAVSGAGCSSGIDAPFGLVDKFSKRSPSFYE